MPTIEIPHYHKLPESLYGDTFRLAEKEKDIYLFHDQTWAANGQHLLGWSREIIHSLSNLDIADNPDWVCGHAYRHQGDGTYKLSATETIVTSEQLVSWAEEAQSALEEADLHTDQWGNTTHDAWHDNLGNHLPDDPIHKKLVEATSALHVFTLRNNYANSIHHPEYPKPPSRPDAGATESIA